MRQSPHDLAIDGDRPMNEHSVIIAGGGPTGLLLASELRLAGVDVAIVERRVTQDIAGLRAGGLHSRSIEILDQRGIADRVLAEGQVAQVAGFAGIRLDISDFPSRHPYGLGLWQNHIERILAGWAEELSVKFYRGTEVTGFVDNGEGVKVELSNGDSLRTAYLVGCDGGRSLVRRAAGIDFPGSSPTMSSLVGEVEMTAEPPLGTHHSQLGLYAFGRRDYEVRDGKVHFSAEGPVNVLIPEHDLQRTGTPTLGDLRSALVAICGTDFGAHSPTWLSSFTDMARLAETYKKGRVLLAGDAAHIHSPVGGQGLNTGLQDAMNLGWKLAQVVKGISPERLLDSYQTERRPVAARVLRNALAQVSLMRPDEHSKAACGAVADLLAMEEARKAFGAMMSGLDLSYTPPGGHPLLGRRMPDLELDLGNGPTSTYSLLHAARPLLLNLEDVPLPGVRSWGGRIENAEARTLGPWELPVIGMIPSPSAVLVRPDGYVAWVGGGDDAGLHEVLAEWFGIAAAS